MFRFHIQNEINAILPVFPPSASPASRNGARLCPQDQSQQFDNGGVVECSDPVVNLDVLRLGFTTTALRPKAATGLET